jgi:hypothetical protein
MEATTLNRPWADLDWDAKIPFVAWVARQVGVDLEALSGEDTDTAEYAVLSFVEELVTVLGGDENSVKAIVEWIVGDRVVLRFVLNRYRESEMVNRQPLEGGILDQKLVEADKLISALWRYLP